MPLQIVIDTREQRPWAFPSNLATVTVGTLHTGDYALWGDEDNFAIERKSLDDFLGTIGSGWERFLREIGRMEGARFKHKIIIVEGNFSDICFSESNTGEIIPPEHHHPKITPQFVMMRIAELSFMDIQVLFCGNPEFSAAMAYYILRKRFYEKIGESISQS